MKAHHKVGVLQVKEGQRNEEDIFCNRHEAGAPFDEFLNVLGERDSGTVNIRRQEQNVLSLYKLWVQFRSSLLNEHL